MIVRHALEKRWINKPALLLEQTRWGKSNQRAMTKALEERGLRPTTLKWFNRGLTEESARILLRQIHATGADAIFLVAKAPTGFIHAYDLTQLLIAAANQVQLKGDVLVDRAGIRDALENLNSPIKGLIKTYKKPFSAFSSTNIDAHEALGLDDFTMGHYGAENQILIMDN